MTVTLYNYTGMDNVANKLLSRLCTKVWEGTITTYGAFTPRGGIFRLSNLYQCNYCTFKYDNITYYANVDVSTDSKGLYVYTCTTDSLATAYYKGCINSSQYYLYFSDWTHTFKDWNYGASIYPPMNRGLLDSRVFRANTKWIHEFTIPGPTYPDTYVVGIYQPHKTETSVATKEGPAISTFALNETQYVHLINWLVDINNYGYHSNIAFVYMVDKSVLGNMTGLPKTRSITMYKPTTNSDRGYWSTTEVTFESDVIRINARQATVEYTISVEEPFPTEEEPYGIDFNQGNLLAIQRVHVRDVGDIYFQFSEISQSGYTFVDNIGYNISYDFSDGIVTAFLNVNGYMFRDKSIQAQIPYRMPIQVDSYIADYKQFQYTATTGIKNAVGSALRLDLGGIVSSGIDAITGMNQQAHDMAMGETSSPTAMVGNASSSTDRSSDNASRFYYTTQQTNEQSTQACFGYLYGFVNSPYNKRDYDPGPHTYGYYQTSNCHFPANGLPKYVIDEANTKANTGFILAPPNSQDDSYETIWPDR